MGTHWAVRRVVDSVILFGACACVVPSLLGCRCHRLDSANFIPVTAPRSSESVAVGVGTVLDGLEREGQ